MNCCNHDECQQFKFIVTPVPDLNNVGHYLPFAQIRNNQNIDRFCPSVVLNEIVQQNVVCNDAFVNILYDILGKCCDKLYIENWLKYYIQHNANLNVTKFNCV